MSDVNLALEQKGKEQEEKELDGHDVGEDEDDGDDGDCSASSTSSDLDENDIGNIFGDQISNFSENINPRQNPLLWVQTQIARCVDPKIILRELVPSVNIPETVSEMSVWRLIFEIITEPAPRQPLSHVCSIENVVRLIRECRNIIVLTGAGVSVSCGIPDFRSRDGIYARLSKDFPDLPDPQSMFDINFFHSNPYPFFRFAKEIYPGQYKPSMSHRFIQHLEASGRLLRNYTQNIDTLEQVAGINNVVHCHGSFSTASCMNCKLKVKADDIKEDVFAQRIPYCKNCTGEVNILKPDIVFFGEGLPDEFHKQIRCDKEKADLLIVIGSSLKVRPVALIPSFLKPEIPQILINREQLPHLQFDVELYGNCDDVIRELCCQLGKEWDHVTESFVPNPLDCEKYKYLLENSPVQCNDPVIRNEINTSTEKNDYECSSASEVCQDGLSSNHSDNSENSMKRKCSDGDENYGKKFKKIQTTEDTMKSDVFYLYYPPNSYIFHGAEMDCSDESEEDTCDNDRDCVDTENRNDSISSEKSPIVSGEGVDNSIVSAGTHSGMEVHAHCTSKLISDNEVPHVTSIDKPVVEPAEASLYEASGT